MALQRLRLKTLIFLTHYKTSKQHIVHQSFFPDKVIRFIAKLNDEASIALLHQQSDHQKTIDHL